MMKKSGIVIYIIAGILFLGGLGVFLYPKVTDLIYRQETQKKKEEFVQSKQGSDIKVEELYQELIRRNRELYESRQSGIRDPFFYEQPTIDLSSYGIKDGIIGFIKVERLGVELPIYLGANEENMSLGAVHLTETSYPVAGENTNSVIAAHRGFSRTAMFRNIQRLEPGDQVVIENFREVLTYQVVDTEVIMPSEVDKLLIQPGRDMVTLLTCHPYRSNKQRYVVYCERVETP